MAIVRVELALKELAYEDEGVAILAQADEICEEHLAEAGGEARREVAHLVGVRENDIAGLEFLDELFERRYVTVRSVIFEQRVLDAIALVELLACELTAERFEITANDDGRQRLAGGGCDLLSGSERFPRHAVIGAATMFEYDQDSAHITRTSNLSFSTSFAAASLGEPSINCVSFFFSGR